MYDLILIGPSQDSLDIVKKELSQKLYMKDLGVLNSFLGVDVTMESNGCVLSQEPYTQAVLARFGMENCKAISTPATGDLLVLDEGGALVSQRYYQESIGSLLFLATRIRPDIGTAVGILSRFCAAPTTKHLIAAKRVLRYLRGTSTYGLVFRTTSVPVVGYSDADWAGDREDRKSTSGALVLIYGCPVYWRSMKQKGVALSTTEAEYLALGETCKIIVWIRALLTEFKVTLRDPTHVYENNAGAIAWGEGVCRAKHVSIRANFIKDHVVKGAISIQYCPTSSMVADILTKPLQRIKFDEHRNRICVWDFKVPGARGGVQD